MISPAEFETGWDMLLQKYGLHKNPFLTQVYEVRHKWAKPYFMGVFCARMTSTQRSESANHLLKTYVPPACPMHAFVRQFEKLQFDRESEESYEEKRTSISGVTYRFNLPIEKHASKVYSRAMYEQFGESMYKSGAYLLDEVTKDRSYIARHIDALSREKWSKVLYKVDVSADKANFSCECGVFEHSGMLCCHIIKVMLEMDVLEIPKDHIMKRWTKDARDILPSSLARYQKDNGPPKTASFRHSKLYVRALECVQLGESNVDSYELGMALLSDVVIKLTPLSGVKDGMGLAEREAVAAQSESGAALIDTEADTLSGCSAVRVSSKKRPLGRPTSSRDKPPYEQPSKRSRFCSICRKEGHKSTTCPDRGGAPKAPRKLPKCSNCGVLGHRKTSCEKPRKVWEVPFL